MFGSNGRVERRQSNGTLYFKNKDQQRQKRLIFYDKVLEMQSRKETPQIILENMENVTGGEASDLLMAKLLMDNSDKVRDVASVNVSDNNKIYC